MQTTIAPLAKSSTQVHQTKDYFLFKTLDGNRALNTLHIKRLLESMRDNYLFTVIIVNENYQIIDGQHRFNCIQELGLPLHYIVCPGYGLREVQVLNANSKNWSYDDYLEGYCDLGYADYILFREFKEQYGFGYNECISLLYRPANGDAAKNFQTGKLKVTSLQEAKDIAERIYLISPYYKGFKRRTFIFAMMGLFKNPNFNFGEFLAKLKLQPTAMLDCSNTAQYLTLIEQIYNYRRREKVNLRF